jgi:hypothetical protein
VPRLSDASSSKAARAAVAPPSANPRLGTQGPPAVATLLLCCTARSVDGGRVCGGCSVGPPMVGARSGRSSGPTGLPPPAPGHAAGRLPPRTPARRRGLPPASGSVATRPTCPQSARSRSRGQAPIERPSPLTGPRDGRERLPDRLENRELGSSTRIAMWSTCLTTARVGVLIVPCLG